MKYSGYYLVRHRPSLADRAAAVGVELEGWLEVPIVFETIEAGRSPWSPTDRILKAKLMFLIWLRSEFGAEEDFQTLFPKALTKADEFDEWWTVETVDCVDAKSAEEQSRSSVVASMHDTGNKLVDRWLRQMTPKR